jgi:hypothetical protein
MGPGVATTFLQRALTALNRRASDFPDLVPDGRTDRPRLVPWTRSSICAARAARRC